MDGFLNFLLISLIVLGIVVVFAIGYFVIWTAIFSPVMKLEKYKTAKLEAEREYHLIEVEHARMIEQNDEQKSEHQDRAVKIADLKSEEWKLRKLIQELTKTVEELEEQPNGKRGRPKKHQDKKEADGSE